jgi:hypothetical protein
MRCERVEPLVRLVEHQHLGLRQERDREADALARPLREPPIELRAAIREAHALEQAPRSRRFASARPKPRRRPWNTSISDAAARGRAARSPQVADARAHPSESAQDVEASTVPDAGARRQ